MISGYYRLLKTLSDWQEKKSTNPTEFYQACDWLIACGWTIWEIERLNFFRERYKQTSMDLPDLTLDVRHLEFIRWLVQTGKLLDG